MRAIMVAATVAAPVRRRRRRFSMVVSSEVVVPARIDLPGEACKARETRAAEQPRPDPREVHDRRLRLMVSSWRATISTGDTDAQDRGSPDPRAHARGLRCGQH